MCGFYMCFVLAFCILLSRQDDHVRHHQVGKLSCYLKLMYSVKAQYYVDDPIQKIRAFSADHYLKSSVV